MDTVTADHLVYQQKMVYEQAGFPVILASAQTGQGKEALQSALCGKISVVAGPSGAGKSSLLNLLEPGFALTTGSISDKLGRGRHTTRYVELLPLTTGGWIADSPGFSRLDLPVELTTEALAALYPDFLQVASHCRFDGCLHDQEPDCAVKAACQKGDIDQGRYQRYLLLLEELRQRQQY